MTIEVRENREQVSQRDQRGRFRPGVTGNPNGRPRKQGVRPKLLPNIIADALEREVTVTDGGRSHTMTHRELLAQTALRGVLKGKPKEILEVLLKSEQIATEAAPDDEELEPIFTEEDRRLIEIVNRALAADETLCARCQHHLHQMEPPPKLPTGLD